MRVYIICPSITAKASFISWTRRRTLLSRHWILCVVFLTTTAFSLVMYLYLCNNLWDILFEAERLQVTLWTMWCHCLLFPSYCTPWKIIVAGIRFPLNGEQRILPPLGDWTFLVGTITRVQTLSHVIRLWRPLTSQCCDVGYTSSGLGYCCFVCCCCCFVCFPCFVVCLSGFLFVWRGGGCCFFPHYVEISKLFVMCNV